MHANQSRIFRLFKYSVYALLTLNIFLFFAEEWTASAQRFSAGIALFDIIKGFPATIDTLAWVVLLLIFELETYVLEDHQFTRRTRWTLQIARVVCYLFIFYAFFGYLSKLLFLMRATPLGGVTDLCSLVNQAWVYAEGLDEYVSITAANCALLTDSSAFTRLAGMTAVVDLAGYGEILRLAWVDVINALVWILVVGLLEMDVQLQNRGQLKGAILRTSNAVKYMLYSILFLAAVYWGFKGSFVDFWDAFLWLVAFAFIELNVLEWQEEDRQAAQTAAEQPAG